MDMEQRAVSQPGSQSGTKGTVLIVDDDAALAEMLTIVLGNEGFTTVVCPTGDGALGVGLTELSKEQAAYLGVHVAGPYKSEHYRY